MAKNPNRSPDKGFIGEIESSPQIKPQQAKKRFTWHKDVSGGESSPQDMGTTQRLKKQAAVAPTKQAVAETAEHIANRRRKY